MGSSSRPRCSAGFAPRAARSERSRSLDWVECDYGSPGKHRLRCSHERQRVDPKRAVRSLALAATLQPVSSRRRQDAFCVFRRNGRAVPTLGRSLRRDAAASLASGKPRLRSGHERQPHDGFDRLPFDRLRVCDTAGRLGAPSLSNGRVDLTSTIRSLALAATLSARSLPIWGNTYMAVRAVCNRRTDYPR